MKIDQIFIKNQSRKDIKLKVNFGNTCFLIFDCFQLDVGPILARKWSAFCCGKRRRKHYRAQTGLQRPSGLQPEPFWKRFGTIFGSKKSMKNNAPKAWELEYEHVHGQTDSAESR